MYRGLRNATEVPQKYYLDPLLTMGEIEGFKGQNLFISGYRNVPLIYHWIDLPVLQDSGPSVFVPFSLYVLPDDCYGRCIW